MDIQPTHLDYITAPLEDIVKGELFRIETSLVDLKDDGKLCCDEGRFLIAEFGFKGDFNAVVEQVEAHVENLRENGLTDLDRLKIQERFMNACTDFAMEKDSLECRDELKEAMRTGDIMTVMKITNRNLQLRQDMHDRKECLCYCNG